MSGLLQIPDLSNGWVILRIMCGAFFVPHIYAKFYVPAALGFFVAAKFNPPRFWMYVAGAIEIVLAIALIFGIFTTFTAAIAALHLMVAAAAVYRVSDGKWLWNIGGSEFCVFWAICCALVAMQS
ncbi:MAG: DoxX family protein [Pseudorhodoplanes sp.]|jgi:putative oxidoreductase|nr:DoxX family protein [Pseudorhodoplanes sp.]